MLLTLYMFPGDNALLDDFQRITSSCEGIDCDIKFIVNREELKIQPIPETKWWGYLFGNEWFCEAIKETLNVYLKEARADVLTFFKDVIKQNGEKAIYLDSRIFKTEHVPLGLDTYKHTDNLLYVKVLDGWIREEKRK